jgi:RHS repeat-associated protein
MSDHQGHMAWTAKHKAWGQADIALSRAARDAGVKNPFRFQGQYFDEESGLHYNRYRYYDAHAGRFVSKDPIGLAGGINLQQYAPNPTAWIDPLGLSDRPLPNGRRVNRVGGNSVENLRLTEAEKRLSPPGISVLHGCTECDAAKQMRDAFPNATRLHDLSGTIDSGTAAQVRSAGFDVIEDRTRKFPNHARIVHPEGAAGFNDKTLKQLSSALGETKKCP